MNRIYLNNNWYFTQEFTEEMCKADYDTGALEQVRLPHTCKELPYNYFDEKEYQMVSGYRYVLTAKEEWKGKCVLFTCEAAAHDASVYVNGQVVCKHSTGYTAFTVDIAPYLKFGEDNIIVIRVDSNESLNVPPFGFVIDYMTYGGIYREVYLEIRDKVHITDIFAKAEPTENNKGSLTLEIGISEGFRNEDADKTWRMRASLVRKFTDICPKTETDKWNEEKTLFEKEIVPQDSLSYTVSQTVNDVVSWDNHHPYLYSLTLQLLHNEEACDSKTVTFGFRSVRFCRDGFYLNGEKLRIRGLNRHQSYPYVGYAMPESMQKYDADILKKELGCNAVRTSHYPQSHHFINRCDELGLLVFTEMPGWQHIGNGEWKMQACQNVREMIREYRNHPSIMIWGVRINESADDDTFYEETNRIAHELDDTRPTGGVRNFKNSHLLEDVYTYNDFVHDGIKPGCEPKKAVSSDRNKAYLITENNGHMFPTKSFDCEAHRLEQALRHTRVIDAVANEPEIAGSFAWCMFDYNTHKDFGSGDRICYHGVTDMFRNGKMAAAVYASQQEETPVLEISSNMDIGEHPASNLGAVYLFTNADSVKMYKNDYFIKEYKKSDSPYQGIPHGPIPVDDFIGDMLETKEGYSHAVAQLMADCMNYVATHGMQKIPAGMLLKGARLMLQYKKSWDELMGLYAKYVGNWGNTATVYRFEAIKDGKVVKTIYKQPMECLKLNHTISHTTLKEGDTYDVAAIRIRAVDENGNLTSYYQEAIEVETEGPVAVIGPKLIACKGGMTGFYVKTTGQTGTAKIRFGNAQVGMTEITLNIVSGEA